jgi:hypothetical protein
MRGYSYHFSTDSRYLDPDAEFGRGLTLQFIKEATNSITPDAPSLGFVQTHLLLSIAYFGIGNGRSYWRELGKSQTKTI